MESAQLLHFVSTNKLGRHLDDNKEIRENLKEHVVRHGTENERCNIKRFGQQHGSENKQG